MPVLLHVLPIDRLHALNTPPTRRAFRGKGDALGAIEDFVSDSSLDFGSDSSLEGVI